MAALPNGGMDQNMHKLALAAALAAGSLAATSAQAQGMSPYAGLGISYQILEADSGGVNTAGPFSNADTDNDQVFGFRAVAGLANMARLGERVSLRGELEFLMPEKASYETFSLAWPYYANDEMYGGFVNLYLDIAVPEISAGTGVFVGGGFGGFRHDLSVTDGVVGGQNKSSAYAWNLGGGVKQRILDNVDLTGSVRYIDYGKVGANLFILGGGPAAGSYDLDQSGIDIGLTLTMSFDGLL
tara:strand:+ start:129399 stop:130124 length:726 start_codon:yes stop_codon:yes gene_type:complete